MCDEGKDAKSEMKTAKAVRILKSFFNVLKVVAKKGVSALKWANENVTVKMVVTVGLILILGSTAISNYLSAVF